MILEPPKIKSDTVSTVSPSISHEAMGPDASKYDMEAVTKHQEATVAQGQVHAEQPELLRGPRRFS